MHRLGIDPVLTDDPEDLRASDRVIFPGVGEASTAMNYLRERKLDAVIRSLTQPVLAVCLGMQLICDSSEENEASCLGILPNRVRRFSGDIKVPQIGWNILSKLRSPLFNDIAEGSYVYFVHSFFPQPVDSSIVATWTDYGGKFASSIWSGNCFATQFHPEKSQEIGLRLLKNFVDLADAVS